MYTDSKSCVNCGTVFFRKKEGPAKWATRACCSTKCNGVVLSRNTPPSDPADFWSRVNKGDGCWMWTGAKMKKRRGYGAVRWDGITKYTHRVSWEITNGEIPDDMIVCHRCDNPPCVRPDHLFLGTDKDNYDDMVAKGRRVVRVLSGEESASAKLSNAQVETIREEYRAGGTSTPKLGRKYGISQTHAYDIVNRKARRRG